MAYDYDKYDGSLVISGFEKGIAPGPVNMKSYNTNLRANITSNEYQFNSKCKIP